MNTNFEMPKYYCSSCGAEISAPGRCFACSNKSAYDLGKEAGRRSVLPEMPKLELPKFELPKTYSQGFNDGRNEALGCPGQDGFDFCGD